MKIKIETNDGTIYEFTPEDIPTGTTWDMHHGRRRLMVETLRTLADQLECGVP